MPTIQKGDQNELAELVILIFITDDLMDDIITLLSNTGRHHPITATIVADVAAVSGAKLMTPTWCTGFPNTPFSSCPLWPRYQ